MLLGCDAENRCSRWLLLVADEIEGASVTRYEANWKLTQSNASLNQLHPALTCAYNQRRFVYPKDDRSTLPTSTILATR